MPHPEQPSYEELAARNAELTARVAELLAVVAEQAALIETLRTEVAALRGRASRDSSNSSQPPSQDSPAAEAKARAGRRRARAGRPQGGQKGHPGAGLQMVARPDEPWSSSRAFAAGAARAWPGAAGRIASRVQVFDIPPVAADGDGVPDDAPDVRVPAGHDRPGPARDQRRPGVLRPERGRCGHAAGQHGRDRDRAGLDLVDLLLKARVSTRLVRGAWSAWTRR